MPRLMLDLIQGKKITYPQLQLEIGAVVHFGGSSELKSLIQLMACSMAGRDWYSLSFGDENLRDQFYNMQIFLANNQITISKYSI
ncbi:hypothetical protein NQ314_001181 [Rhamnusium bicolor]|uniref:PARG catalytic Macro domain-containing protein n=1 Tax=Rhamnusium bicolor TaxID=1586634 RepID=A0AAV8ZV29_9CUCU|nr:hypothetical protein NQ314_001181 [Rhamnusium bicolor]